MRYARRRWGLVLVLFTLAVSVRGETAGARLMRYPDLAAGRIAFVWSNDIWIVKKDGGVARRLTADGRPKSHLHFSPDGADLGYSMTVGGNPDIYIVSAAGGVPRRVTHHPGPDLLVDWYADSRSLLIASPMLSSRPVYNRLFKVPVTGGLPVALPLAHGETAALSKSGQQVIYTVYRDFQEEAWKRYRGGRSPDLWYLDIATGQSRRLTNDDAPDSWPMWAGQTVFFLSERGDEQRSNLWALDLDRGTSRQLTHFTDFDVRHPSRGDGSIVFEAEGKLYVMDDGEAQPREVPVVIEADRSAFAPARVAVADRIESVDVSADGSLVAIGARGDLLTISREPELVTNVTRSAGIAERYPSLSPDARRLAYFSDDGGEYQLSVRDLATSAVRVLTRFADGFRYKPQWSPDARRIAFIDNRQAVHVVDVQSGRDRVIDHDSVRDHFGLEAWRASWSPNGRWMAYARAVENRNQAVFLYDANAGVTHPITSGVASDVAAVFGPEGDYLYLLSYRQLRPTFGDVDPTWTYANSMGISVIPLRKSVRAPFLPATATATANSAASPSGSIDLDGLEQRLVAMPVPPGTFADLVAVPGRLIYRRMTEGAAGGEPVGLVETLDIQSGRTSTLTRDADELSAGTRSETVLVRKQRDYLLVPMTPASGSADAPAHSLPLERLYAPFDRRQENRQQFADAWRYVRDFFYDPALHGLDWAAIRERYRPLVDEAQTDEDMSALLREIAGELSAGHVWAFSGDGHPPGWSDARVGLLGVDFEVRDGAYRIARILDPGTAATAVRSPLAEPALGVREGDYLVAVNRMPLSIDVDPFAAFENEADALVRLTINSRPGTEGAREVVVRTLANESKLRESVWVEENRRRVEQRSAGRVGYIYVPDTSANGQTDLVLQYRAQYSKEALVIDERFNRGGALGDRLVELLNRPPLNFFVMRNATTYALPELSHGGPKAMLINGWSYSGGDGFPFLFKTAQLGKIVGTRTWGGLIGPSLPLPLISGGKISVAHQRVRDVHGDWAEGNHGVVPDVEIDNDPARLAEGTDDQLNKAVSIVLQQLTERPPSSVSNASGARR